MSIERLQQLVDTIKIIDDLKNQVINNDSMTERANAQYESVLQIQNYIGRIAEVTKDVDWDLKLPQISLYWLNQNKDKSDPRTKCHHITIYFRKGKVTFEEPAFASSLTWYDFCNMPREKIYKHNSKNEIETDFIRLINNWSQIKSLIEVGAEKVMLDKIKEREDLVKNFKGSYERAINFEI